MAEKSTYHAVYITKDDADTEPLALFKHADAAQQWRKQHYGDQGMVAPSDITVGGDSAVSDQLAVPEEPAAAAVGEDFLRAQIRAELTAERTQARLRREVEAELDEEDAKGETSTRVELREPASTAAPPRASAPITEPEKPSTPPASPPKPPEADTTTDPKPAKPDPRK